MSVQTSYDLTPDRAYPGLVDTNNPSDIVTRACKTAGGIGFGLVVSPGTDEEKECVLGGDATGFGISVRDSSKENPASGDPEYDQYEAVAIIRSGYVWAEVATAAVAGAALFYDDTTGAIDSGIAGSDETEMSNCELVTNVDSNGDVGLIRINAAATL